ncbi:MAG: hypothetical protein H7144_07395 [Burkholderiales bacterium]|nr:hypothetical protein [Phycisphaerae bacterium]
MWKEYRKRFVVTQVLIALAVLVAWQVAKVPGSQLGLMVVAMELGAVIGAFFGASLKRRIDSPDDDLPLKPR